MVVQVPTVRTLLDVAVLGEVLHPDPHVDHGLPAVLTVQTGLRGRHRRVSHRAPPSAAPHRPSHPDHNAAQSCLRNGSRVGPSVPITKSRVSRAEDRHSKTHHPSDSLTPQFPLDLQQC